MATKQYPITDKLNKNPSRHCATIAVTESLVEGRHGLLQVGQPDEKSRNGTLTFVKSEGKTFAITCWHVIDYYHKLLDDSNDRYSHSLYTMTPRPYIVVDGFIRPRSESEYHELDIAIIQVRKDFVKALGKEPIDLDDQKQPQTIEFGLAVGFPEGLKYEKEDAPNPQKKIISLPTLSIIAEIEQKPNQRFTLFSEFDKVQGYETYSGMSGSPIFWSTEDDYGIYGITYEANSSNFTEHGKSIMLAGELATPDVIKHWISQIPDLLPD